MKKRKTIEKILCFFLIFSLLPWNTVTVKADMTSGHTSYFIRTLINSNGGYESLVVTDTNNWGDGDEENMLKRKGVEPGVNPDGTPNETPVYVSWADVDYSNPIGASGAVSKVSVKPKLDDKTGLPFSFPSAQRGSSTGAGSNYNNDYKRAISVSSTLSANLNNLISAVKGYYPNFKEPSSSIDKINNAIKITKAINPGVSDTYDGIQKTESSNGNWKIVKFGNLRIFYADFDATKYDAYLKTGQAQYDDGQDGLGAKMIDNTGNLLAYITNNNEAPDKLSQGFIWAMPKGYLNPVTGISKSEDNKEICDYWGVFNKNQPNQDLDKNIQGDAIWLTIFSLAEFANAQAMYFETIEGSSGSAELDSAADNFIENTIYNMLLGVYSDLLSLLKLSPINDLVYNQGIRSGSSYEDGLMSTSWWNQVLKYHLIFQIAAWMMLIAAIAKILIQVNFSTINPQLTISIMDTFEKIFTVGFALALCVPFIKAMVKLNNLIVDIFQTEATDGLQIISGMSIAGILVMLGFFGITFTMNCIYIMRGLMIGILTASAPLFITSMAFAGPKQKGLFDNWIKEISANIFMQSVHAFALAFLFDIMDSSNLLVQLVIYFSLLPIVDMCRQLVFGQAGGFAVAQGKQAGQGTLDFVEKRFGAQVKGVANLAAGKTEAALGIQNRGVDQAGSSDGGTTEGEGKASRANADLGNRMTNIADRLKHGNVGQKDPLIYSDDRKSILGVDENVKRMNHIKDIAARGAGTLLGGMSKLGDAYESTGGLAHNTFMEANHGNMGGAMQATEKYSKGLERDVERTGKSIADTYNNAKQNKLINDKNKESLAATEAYNLASQMEDEASAAYDTMLELGSTGGDKEKISKYNKIYEDSTAKAKEHRATAEAHGKKATQLEDAIAKHRMKRGESSTIDKNGDRDITCNKFNYGLNVDSNGFAFAYLSDEEAYNFYGSDYKDYWTKDGYALGFNHVESKTGSQMKFKVPSKTNERGYREMYDYCNSRNIPMGYTGTGVNSTGSVTSSNPVSDNGDGYGGHFNNNTGTNGGVDKRLTNPQ